MTERDEIHGVGHSMRQLTTAAVLFHHALAERLGLGPTDLKCLEILRGAGHMSGSQLAAATGLTTGAVTGIVARLESAGFLERSPDPLDARKQILAPVEERVADLHVLFHRMHTDLGATLDSFDEREVQAIVAFLEQATAIVYRQVGELRTESITPPRPATSYASSHAKRRSANKQ